MNVQTVENRVIQAPVMGRNTKDGLKPSSRVSAKVPAPFAKTKPFRANNLASFVKTFARRGQGPRVPKRHAAPDSRLRPQPLPSEGRSYPCNPHKPVRSRASIEGTRGERVVNRGGGHRGDTGAVS